MQYPDGLSPISHHGALAWVVVLLTTVTALAQSPWRLDEKPAQAGEWGFRPADESTPEVNPPAFVWRPQAKTTTYNLQVAADADFSRQRYEVRGLTMHCHCPPHTFEPGTWHWRFRAVNEAGQPSAWSSVRTFTVKPDTAVMPMPPRDELLARIPKTHPRLFLRPEQLDDLRQRAQGDMKDSLQRLTRQCDNLLKKPPPTEEPPKYPPGTSTKSEEWRTIWWGNRVYTIAVLENAATLAFTRLLTGNDQYGQLARRLLMDAAKWDPKGATGYRYNDEAGMPYAYFFSRTYTFLHDYLSEEDRVRCREVMRIRGQEMYNHLAPRHIWRPYGSHANRAWHFLGEVGIAFLDEVPEAADWVWFAMNVFFHAYPVWSDADGGWHEGMAYWRSYISRFTWWADIMRTAMDIDAYRKPYFSQIGYYPLYLQPPGTYGGGFGDLTGRLESPGNVPLMSIFAAQAANPHWQWYVQAHKPSSPAGGYVGFLRGALPEIPAQPPTDLPTSRCFRGIGQAVFNTNLLDAAHNVSFLFKSSPFGTQSHGYDANNAFLLSAFGKPLFISSGWRDIYGSEHHTNWMWHTKSTNCITVNGQTQGKRTAAARGEILDFSTGEHFDYVVGEAGSAYGDLLERFTRRVLFAKPDLIVIHDQLVAREPATFEWRLHAPNEMHIDGRQVLAHNGPARCHVDFLYPADLVITQTDQFDPPPRPRVKLTEYHLTAATPAPARTAEFITVLRPYQESDGEPVWHRRPAGGHPAGAIPESADGLKADVSHADASASTAAPSPANVPSPSAASPLPDLRLEPIPNGHALTATLPDGTLHILLRTTDQGELRHPSLTTLTLTTDAPLAAVRLNPQGQPIATFPPGDRCRPGD
ncbi:MAG: DUF4962 domain-containing protein [Phycisphaerae bacterium]|mgnify:CR=1 FL=1|nr:DUF4962 domain-containing protein [Phycisphaerae bacterium]